MHPQQAATSLPLPLRPLVGLLGLALCSLAWSADPAPEHGGSGHKPAAAASATASASTPAASDGARTAAKTAPIEGLPTASGNPLAEKIRAALSGSVVSSKKMTVTVEDKEPPVRAAPVQRATPTASKTLTSRRYNQARSTAVDGHGDPHAPAVAAGSHGSHGSDVHWSYEGEGGPQAWGKLKPEFNVCAIGKRQSPINIEDGVTLQGPAEPVQFAYTPSNATVVNNGHTIQVDVQGDNSITVRGSTYRLLQFHFHTPSEEQINFKRFPMVAHLVHKNNEGQLAVVAVLLDDGAANAAIDKVWTYMPLDMNDRVRMPAGLLNLGELLPTDQRYYQFMGSLTTPPCTEGVLWIVMKQPVTISKAQYKLFTQLYPNNARPVQPLNGRPVREAQ